MVVEHVDQATTGNVALCMFPLCSSEMVHDVHSQSPLVDVTSSQDSGTPNPFF